MRIFVTGPDGMLGRDVMAELASRHALFPYPEEALDITDRAQVEKAVRAARPDALINCAAYTDVDGCESHAALAHRVNGTGAGNLAAAAESVGAKILHVSTDYVFDGTAKVPYTEDAATGPVTEYGKSKLAGEQAVRKATGRHFIVRTAWLYGEHGHNFVFTMLRLAAERDRLSVVDDQVGNPTWTRDLAAAIGKLIETDAYGTYHASGEGECSWYDFTREIFRLRGIDTPVDPVGSSAYPRPARRPAYSGLDKGALKRLGITMPPWRASLAAFLEQACGPSGKKSGAVGLGS